MLLKLNFLNMNKVYIIVIALLMIVGVSLRANSQVVAVDDNVRTGPMQIARIDVTKNDIIQCVNHSLSIVSVTLKIKRI